ncbi:hypothetical protein TNCV_634671 [Trichonephila clavipes]|nr:hypothetical protein TNCV_634671 [Trichonephila clavipes]
MVRKYEARRGGRSSRVAKVSDRGWPCHEFEPSTTKDSPCGGEMHVKSVESSNVLPLVWCGTEKKGRPFKMAAVSQNNGQTRRDFAALSRLIAS